MTFFRKTLLIIMATGTALSLGVAQAAAPFDVWLEDIKREAIAEGISQSTVFGALNGIKPIERVIELDRKQPEGKLTFAQYKQRVISQQRINQGRRMYQEHRALLEEVARAYGVQPQYIVALWGIETSYGRVTGGFSVVRALATLAHEGRRADFFKSELINALKILDQGHIEAPNMKGSWAGAMGQNQFMPSSFHAFAVDGNNDGKRDIWTSLPDVFASTANYLKKSGWSDDYRWGRRVQVSAQITEDMLGRKKTRSLKEWARLGVRKVGGGALPTAPGLKAGLIAPDGLDGPAYLVYNNFNVVMKWNRSTYFATSVGILADAIASN